MKMHSTGVLPESNLKDTMKLVFKIGRRHFYQRNDGWWGCGTSNNPPKEWHKWLWSLMLSKGI